MTSCNAASGHVRDVSQCEGLDVPHCTQVWEVSQCAQVREMSECAHARDVSQCAQAR